MVVNVFGPCTERMQMLAPDKVTEKVSQIEFGFSVKE
jgi:hypothetical protein